MKAMKTGPCRYCGKAGHAFDASKGMLFRFPFEKGYLCAPCQMDFIRTLGERSIQAKNANPGMAAKELLKTLEDLGREVDLEMRSDRHE